MKLTKRSHVKLFDYYKVQRAQIFLEKKIKVRVGWPNNNLRPLGPPVLRVRLVRLVQKISLGRAGARSPFQALLSTDTEFRLESEQGQ